MTQASFDSICKTEKGLTEDLSSLSLGATNDNSNPQQGNGIKCTTKKDVNETEGSSANNSVEVKLNQNRIDPNKKEERKLFVGGLPGNVTDEEFRAFFEQYGPVLDSVVMFDRETHNSRGFGFVTFKEVAVAQAVLGGKGRTKNIVTINDKDCEVKVSVPKKHMDSKRSDRKHKNREDNQNSNGYSYSRVKNQDDAMGKLNEKQYMNGVHFMTPYGPMVEMPHGTVEVGEMNQMNYNPSYPINYNYPQGTASMPMYPGPNGTMMPDPNMTPQSQSLQEDQDPNFMYGSIPYQYNHANPPYFGYPVSHPQMVYPYMMPQYYSIPHNYGPVQNGYASNSEFEGNNDHSSVDAKDQS